MAHYIVTGRPTDRQITLLCL